jgi:hypothetical protein
MFRDNPFMKPVSEDALNERAVSRGAPRVTLQAIEDNILAENYFSAMHGALAAAAAPGTEGSEATAPVPEGLRRLTFCILTLKNGFTVTGQSSCVDIANFDGELGNKLAREDAVRQIWPLMGYELRTRLAGIDNVGDDDLGEALTRMTAFTLGNAEAFRTRDADLILKHFTGTDHSEEGGKTIAHA